MGAVCNSILGGVSSGMAGISAGLNGMLGKFSIDAFMTGLGNNLMNFGAAYLANTALESVGVDPIVAGVISSAITGVTPFLKLCHMQLEVNVVKHNIKEYAG